MPELEKVKCSTPDLAAKNAANLLKLFPECEGENGTVDLDKLRQVLSSKVVEGNVERYEFTWPGKRAAKAAASAATTKTLRPCREESVNFDTTENLYIEGDNLEVLKLLQTNYAGKVKMIYIDPPYNTGHDFVYRDSFSLTDKELAERGNQIDDGKWNVEHPSSNESAAARYHSNWCSMMYPRLKLARQMMKGNAVLFMSIDDNEIINARKLCDEVFGEANFVSCCIRRTINSGKHDITTIAPFHEYLLIYAKSIEEISLAHKPKEDSERDRLYKEEDEFVAERGRYYITQLNKNSLQYSDGLNYPIKGPDGVEIWPGGGPDDKVWIWRWSKAKVQWGIENGFIVFKQSGGKYKVYTKSYEFRDNDNNPIDRNNPYSSLEFVAKEYANFNATPELERLFDGKKVFDFPKSKVFLKEVLKIANDRNALVLDFFSGSATTADAVMELNAEDGGSRRFIMVQLPEICEAGSAAESAGYENLCKIGEDRIRRAGKMIAEENATNAPNLDIGFRVLKLDSSSLNDTSATVSETDQKFENFDRIKSDRSSEDLLFQMLLETHIPLSDKIAKTSVGGNEVFVVGAGYDGEGAAVTQEAPLVACLDAKAKMTSEFFMEVAKLKPGIAFFRDDAFADDSARTNLQQAFNQFSPGTSIKVI